MAEFGPSVVARSFVSKYFSSLSTDLGNMFKYYNHGSSLFISEFESAQPSQQYTSIDEIKAFFTESTYFQNCAVYVASLDFCPVVQDSILVSVNGTIVLASPHRHSRAFQGTFLLHRMELTRQNWYFVKTCLFRWMSPSTVIVAPLVSAPETEVVISSEAPEVAIEQVEVKPVEEEQVEEKPVDQPETSTPVEPVTPSTPTTPVEKPKNAPSQSVLFSYNDIPRGTTYQEVVEAVKIAGGFKFTVTRVTPSYAQVEYHSEVRPQTIILREQPINGTLWPYNKVPLKRKPRQVVVSK
ncbi:hypothetical protein RCL1_008449 [Eukaryota sp. TZLM3-RCL]